MGMWSPLPVTTRHGTASISAILIAWGGNDADPQIFKFWSLRFWAIQPARYPNLYTCWCSYFFEQNTNHWGTCTSMYGQSGIFPSFEVKSLRWLWQTLAKLWWHRFRDFILQCRIPDLSTWLILEINKQQLSTTIMVDQSLIILEWPTTHGGSQVSCTMPHVTAPASGSCGLWFAATEESQSQDLRVPAPDLRLFRMAILYRSG